MKPAKLLKKVQSGQVQGVSFADFCQLMDKLGFQLRQRGSHHIYSREGVAEIVNLQPNGKEAKAYQVRQVIDLIEQYGLTL